MAEIESSRESGGNIEYLCTLYEQGRFAVNFYLAVLMTSSS